MATRVLRAVIGFGLIGFAACGYSAWSWDGFIACLLGAAGVFAVMQAALD
jgi:hypothetical protein